MAAPPRKRASAKKAGPKATAKAIVRKKTAARKGPATRKSAAKKVTRKLRVAPSVDPNTFGAQMGAHRQRLGVSQTAFEKMTKIPKARLSRYENGHVDPSLATLEQYSKALDVTITVTGDGVTITDR